MKFDEALQSALDFEEKGKDIYVQAKENTKSELLKATYEYLAAQEEFHIKEIRRFIRQHTAGKPQGDRPKETEKFFGTTAKEFSEKVALSDDDVKAYETALSLEQESYNFYKRQLKVCYDKKAQALFAFLIEQEKAHFELIQKSYEFIKDPESFYQKEEKGEPEHAISKFYLEILEAMKSEQIFPASVKPNIAFYEEHGFPGLRALKKIIEEYKKADIQVILDAKRADIGKTSAAYAKSAFSFWEADAVTVAPYMGSDSVAPFIDYCGKGKGVYVLVRTSNKGAVDIQNLNSDGEPIYRRTAQKLLDWSKPGTGAVVGATYPKELEELSSLFVQSGKEIPLLIPGVGAQGGSAEDVVNALKKTKNPLEIHRINSSAGINYAYLEEDTDDYPGAAVKALKKLNKEIGSF